jgi:hypothetical protein
MIVVKNRRVVIPFFEDIEITVPKNIISYNRGEQVFIPTSNTSYQIELPFTPLCTELTEIYVNGLRRINRRLQNVPGGAVYSDYNVYGNKINLTDPLSGDIKIICEMQPAPEYNVTVMEIDNTQGYLSAGISLFFEPVVMSEPMNGYARLSIDRKELVYQPKLGFVGQDSFSYTLINNQGQFGTPKCVYINVS